MVAALLASVSSHAMTPTARPMVSLEREFQRAHPEALLERPAGEAPLVQARRLNVPTVGEAPNRPRTAISSSSLACWRCCRRRRSRRACLRRIRPWAIMVTTCPAPALFSRDGPACLGSTS